MTTASKEIVKDFDYFEKELDFDFCTRCGSCVASCPPFSIELEEEGPVLKGECDRDSCSLCSEQCPQFVNDLEMAEHVFGEKPEPEGIGIYQDAYAAKTNSPEIQTKSQDGGIVTTLLTTLLEDGFISGAVVMGLGDEPWRPTPKIVLTPEEVIECAGTKYSPAPMLAGARDAVDLYYLERMALVGTPCQIKAFRRMEVGERVARRISSRVRLVIGLFCMENFPYQNIGRIVEEKFDFDLSDVAKFDIDKGKFIVYRTKKSKKDVDVKELDQFVFTPCRVCSDFTSELADVSIGSVGSPAGYSTVLVRTQGGIQAFNRGVQAEAFETEPLEEVKPGLKTVKKVSSSKKRGAREEIERRMDAGEPLPPRLEKGVD